MKLLLVTRLPPSLGGLETMGALIAREWHQNPELELRVVTNVPGPTDGDMKMPVIRCPKLKELTACYRWADVVFFNNLYLGVAIPLLWVKRPYVVSMSGNLERADIGVGVSDWIRKHALRQLLTKATRNISACAYVDRFNQTESRVIPNPYDENLYHTHGAVGERPYDFIFGGRIIQEIKGCFDLIDAFAACCKELDRRLILSVAGDGPDLEAMKCRAAAAGVFEQVRFLGKLNGPALAEELRQHRIVVVPSRYQEPIGIICLEGIASGCLAIGSDGGGLGESVGPCGLTYPRGDVAELTRCMTSLAAMDTIESAGYLAAASGHLAKYRPATVAGQYLAEIRLALDAWQ